MKVLSLFSGIGAFEKALTNLGIPFDLIGYCEIDKYASMSYSAIHGVSESLNLGDITKIDEKQLPKDIDLITYGFPCQDISIAGSQKGLFNADGTQTRSGLFFDALRIIKETKPCVAIAENVKNLTSKKFALQFKIVLNSLQSAGYNNYFQVLNAKNFSIPQNRERVFIVSIRKDIDNGSFTFPEGFELETRLKDIMEETVDERFFLRDDAINNINLNMGQSGCGKPEVRQLGNCFPTKTRDNPNQGRIYDKNGISPALNCMGGGNRQPFVIVEKVGNIYPSGGENGNVYLDTGLCPTLKAGTGVKGNGIGSCNAPKVLLSDSLRIRKLTPKECFRLMGFCNSDFDKAESVNSNTQLYKQAGNSIVVPVVQHIIEKLLESGVLPNVNVHTKGGC